MFLVYAGIFLTVGAVSAIECPDRWVSFRGSCYLFGHGMSLMFVEAEHYCKQHGGSLVQIDSAVENAFIKDLATQLRDSDFWLGITDELTEGVWQLYDTKTNATYFDWHPGQPDDNSNHEDCVDIQRDYHYQWNDRPCTDKLQPICEIRDTEGSVIG